jgi:ATP-dependent helicase/nuclease subunit A
MSELVIPEQTRLDQSATSDPRASAWVSANAGSGKTYVLAMRIQRLLLDGVDPARILALTFTKAAAANMSTRVFKTLGEWVTLPDADLTKVLTDIDGQPPSPERLRLARRLFARAVETPGGLKIQTIHAFCERLLHLFPFEANVAARFEVLDDATGAEMRAAAQGAAVAAAVAQGEGPLADALAVLTDAAGEDGFAGLVKEAMALRHEIDALTDPGASSPVQDGGSDEESPGLLRRSAPRNEGTVETTVAELAERLGLEPGDTRSGFERAMVEDGIPPAEWPELISALNTGLKKEKELGASLAKALEAGDISDKAALYASVFLTAKNEPRADGYLTKAFRTASHGWASRMDPERARLMELLDRCKAADIVARTRALLVLAGEVIRRYEARKSATGALDFDDLIARTLRLLQRHEAAWVLYKLDQGIDHILVDEAQDTSDPQWRILDALVEEFVAGSGSSPRTRTIFAVGDPKQSIFSFQGASPGTFEKTKRRLDTRFKHLAIDDPERWRFVPRDLTLSFRSAPEILNAVDTVFALPDHFDGLSFEDKAAPKHQSARPNAPGIVEIWDTIRPGEEEQPDAWARPLDLPEEGSPPELLARRIARLVRRWNTEGDENGRRIPPGDVLILVRRRGPFFEAMIRALKEAGVPVAGADRLGLTGHIAVMDLIALGRASLLPEDDLTLATVLRSPLVGLSEAQLETLAMNRKGPLHRALAEAGEAGEDPQIRLAASLVARWRTLAGRSGPFGFYAQVLGPDGGRRRMLGRLGPEAGDAMDEFLRLALDREQRDIPALAPFLAELAAADLTVKRDMEAERDQVRVMTVHGAKGLEAPVVFLADTCTAPDGKHDPKIFLLSDPATGRSVPAWSPKQACDPTAVALARGIVQKAARDEYDRLLYVAMTRAKDRLVIAGFEGRKKRPDRCWYDMVRSTLAPLMAEVDAPDSEGKVLRLARAGIPPLPAEAPREPRPEPPLPDWARRPAPAEPAPAPILRPSSAGASEAKPAGKAGAGAQGRAIGTVVHALLEALPACVPGKRREAAERLAAARAPKLDAAQRARIVAEVTAIMAEPGLAPLFGPGSRAEATVAGTLPLGPGGAELAVSGQIDRLAVTADEVIIADYKTSSGEPPAEPPPAYVAQLAVYRALLARLYPGRPVRCLLVWTTGPRVDTLSDAVLDAALAGIKAA